MVSALYIFPLVMLALYLFADRKYTPNKISGVGRELVGRASYHILYAQMIYYVYRPLFDERIFDIKKFGMPIEILINLIVCLVFGISFYLVDKKIITGRIIKSITLPDKRYVYC